MRSTSWVVAAAILWPALAQAENMMTASSLSPGTFTLGTEFQAGLVQGTPLTLNLHEAVGLKGGFDLYARQGFGLSDQPTYFGAGIAWQILSGGRRGLGLALLAGGHYYLDSYAGADVTLLLDFPVGRVTPFLGLDANIDFPEEVDFKLGLDGGVRISLVKNVAWFIEAGVGLTGNPKPHFISTGPKISI